MIDHEMRISEIEKEISQLNYKRFLCLEKAQEIQQELAQINEAVLTRNGEIIGLKRLIKLEKENGINSPQNM